MAAEHGYIKVGVRCGASVTERVDIEDCVVVDEITAWIIDTLINVFHGICEIWEL